MVPHVTLAYSILSKIHSLGDIWINNICIFIKYLLSIIFTNTAFANSGKHGTPSIYLITIANLKITSIRKIKQYTASQTVQWWEMSWRGRKTVVFVYPNVNRHISFLIKKTEFSRWSI